MNSWTEPSRIAGLLAGCGRPWGFAGGWAVDLFLGRLTRVHKDVDVAVLRRDQLAWQVHLLGGGWDLQVASGKGLVAWRPGEALTLPRHCIWCRHANFVPGFLEILLNEASDTHLLFRRDTTIRLALASAFPLTSSGLPVLAPEVVLLYKAKYADQEPHTDDFRRLLPSLDPARRAWLSAGLRRLHEDHPWLLELPAGGLPGEDAGPRS